MNTDKDTTARTDALQESEENEVELEDVKLGKSDDDDDDAEYGVNVVALEEGGSAPPTDASTPLLNMISPEQMRKHDKMMEDPKVRHRVARGDRRAVSDLVMMMNLPEDNAWSNHQKKRRKAQSAFFLETPDQRLWQGADLAFAEEVQAFGTARDRKMEGISEDTATLTKEEENKKEQDDFVYNHVGHTSEEAAKLLEEFGPNELPENVTPAWLVFLRLLIAPMPCMIWAAVIIEAAIENWLDMGILLGIQFTNTFISFYETNKAGNAVAALKDSMKPLATAKRDGKFQEMDATLLVPGDLVLLASGSAIPADCRVNTGEIEVDQAALTGESLPVTFYKGDSCKMGSTVVRGEVEGTVEFTGANTFFGKTASLLKETNELSHLQKVLMTIMKVLVGLSLVLCLITFIYYLVKKVEIKEALSFTVVLLVASIPLAIEIVTTTTLAIGSKKLVAHGAIVSKLSAIEELAGMSILCSDKTGTLTLNKMVLQDDTPVYAEGATQETVLVMASLAAKWKEPPRDALDRLTLGNVKMDLLEPYEQTEYVPFDPQTKRTEGSIKDTRTGKTFKTSKGAPNIILGLLDEDSRDVRNAVEEDVARLGTLGIRSLAVARYEPDTEKWEMQGLLTFLDPPRPDTKKTIEDAKDFGVEVKMITGDHLLIAVNTALQLGMTDHIFTAERLPMLDPETKEKPKDLSETYGDLCLAATGFAQVFPEHKYLIVECLREMGYVVAMTGDGVNDAPALKRADIGIAVAGATDAARAAADIILTEEGLGTIIHGIVIAREIFSRISNFITYRIAATLQLLFFFFIATFAFQPATYKHPDSEEFPDFFHVPVLMLMLITLLNDGTLITIAYDNATASKTPNKWNLKALFVVSSTLGAMSCFSSLILLHLMLDSWRVGSFFDRVGIGGVAYGQIITAIYLKVSVSDFLTLFSARTGDQFFFKIAPAPMLLAGGAFALTLSSILSIFWPETTLDRIPVEGLMTEMGIFVFVWLFSIVFWVFQDVLKVMTYRLMYKTNFNGINNKGTDMPKSAQKLISEFDAAMGEAKFRSSKIEKPQSA